VWETHVIEHFPVAATACRLLITTRSRTLARQINGKDVFLAMLTDREGAALIALRAGGSSDDPIYQQIARLLGGHTLAIRLAAEQLVNQYADSAADLFNLLNQQENLFTHLKLTEDNKDENVERSLSLSYSALPPEMQRRFRALGVLAVEGTFNRSMLAALWGERSEDAVRLPLSAFVSAGLINNDSDGRFSQHRLLRAYARALLTGVGEVQSTFARYADFVIEQAKQFDTLPLEQWRQLDPLLPHVSETGESLTERWDRAANPDDDLTQRCGNFAYNTIVYVRKRPQMIDAPRGRERLGLRWLEMGLAVSRKTGDQKREALFCNDLGGVWSILGDKRKALDYYEQALPVFHTMGEQSGEATALNNIGGVWADLGDKRRALNNYEQALHVFRTVKDQRGEATALTNIGGLWADLGDKHKALGYFEQALPLLRVAGDQSIEAATLTNIGKAWDTLGEKRKALDYYEQALSGFRLIGDQRGEGVALSCVSAIWADLGEPRKALEYYEQALPVLHAVGDRHSEAMTLTNIGMVWDNLGEKRKALEYYEQALPLGRSVGDRRGETLTLNNIATLYFNAGEFDKAAATLQQIIPVAHELGAVADEAAYLCNIAIVYAQLGKVNDAIQSAESAKAILVSHGLPQDTSGATPAHYDLLLARLRGQPQPQPKRALLSQLGNLLRGKRG